MAIGGVIVARRGAQHETLGDHPHPGFARDEEFDDREVRRQAHVVATFQTHDRARCHARGPRQFRAAQPELLSQLPQALAEARLSVCVRHPFGCDGRYNCSSEIF